MGDLLIIYSESDVELYRRHHNSSIEKAWLLIKKPLYVIRINHTALQTGVEVVIPITT